MARTEIYVNGEWVWAGGLDTPTSAPSVPQFVGATLDGTTVTIDWTEPSTVGNGITNYQIQTSVDQGPWSTIATVGNVTSYEYVATADGSYQFRVAAINAEGQGPFSDPTTALNINVPDAPTAPPSITATLNGDDIDLVWTAASSDTTITNYRVQRNVNSTSWVDLVTLGNVLSHTDTAPAAGSYRYRVAAANAVGYGPYSLDSNPAVEIAGSSEKYLRLPGAASAVVSTPSSTALRFAGATTMRVRIRCQDWTPAENKNIVSVWGASGNYGWAWKLRNTGQLNFQRSNNGTAVAANNTAAAPSPALTDGVTYWLQFTVNADWSMSISTHPDQVAEPTTGWTEVAVAPPLQTLVIHPSTADLIIGGIDGDTTSQVLQADIFQMVLYDASSTKVFQLDPANWTTGTTWITSTGQTMTLEGQATIETS